MSGVFLYPSTDSQQLTFNSQDSINVSWSTFAQNFTSPRLMLWLTTSPQPHFLQKLVLNVSVPTNGSLLVPLNYGGGYNLSNFNIQQGPLGAPNPSFYESGHFNIQVNNQSKPQTWGLEAVSSTSLLTSATSTSTLLATLTSSPTSVASLASSSLPLPTFTPSSSHALPTHDKILIIVFSILVAFAIALLLALLIIKTRRLKRLQNEVASGLHQGTALHPHGNPNAARSMAELGVKDARRGELSGGWAGYELGTEATKIKSPIVRTEERTVSCSQENVTGDK